MNHPLEQDERALLRWYDHLSINAFWLGINVASGTLTPVLLPYLVALFAPSELKNTYLATLRVIGLAIAMAVQPMAGMLSDRSTHPLGRRRPFIIAGALLNILFLFIIGASTLFVGSGMDAFFWSAVGASTAYVILLIGVSLLQVSSNIAHGALQGLIPDRVPQHQRGLASGVKAVMELAPLIFVIFIGRLVDRGQIWLTVGVLMLAFLITMLVTVFGVREDPLRVKPSDPVGERLLRLVALTVIFVAVTQAAVWIVRTSGTYLERSGSALWLQLTIVGLAALVGMAGAIFLGVYFGAWVGIGRQARQQTSFIWWVVNRLLFLAGVGSIQGFAQYFFSDVLHVENAATMTTLLMAIVGVFLMVTAIGGGVLADRLGRTKLVAASGLVAACGTLLLVPATSVPWVMVCGCVIGIGAGTFMATNWAMGTDLAPARDAGLYLGISNLAGAGAGIVGQGIGGPLADHFNRLGPGLGYRLVFLLYGVLFLLSVATLSRVRAARKDKTPSSNAAPRRFA